MILKGARVALGATETARLDLTIDDSRVHFGARENCAPVINLEGLLILPGLINAHDHLEFNLFPRLGDGPYPNASRWAADIYRPNESPIREQLRIPKPLRLIWGGIKNLISGVTSVLHHNPYEAAVFGPEFPVRVIEHFGWAHSLAFERDVALAFSRTPPGSAFLIHACEGTDQQSADEVYGLDDAGVLGPSTVLVHGVGLDENGIALLKRRRASLVWCPSSNYFTLGRTLSCEVLDSGIPIALGTDSALTGSGDLVDEMELASREVGAERVYRMVTEAAARILRLNLGEGTIQEGGIADLVVVRDRGQSPAEALHGLDPELVVISGMIKLASMALANRFVLPRFRSLEICERGRWLVDCDMATLVEAVEPILGKRFRWAGREVAA